MSVTNQIQYRGYNFYKIQDGERFRSSSFEVKGGSPLSMSYVIYSTMNLAEANRTQVYFIGNTGLQESVASRSYSYTVGEFKEVAHEAIEVPMETVRATVEFKSQAGEVIWLGLPKAEHGTVATAFTNNYQGQLSRMTATGLYTGTVTAERVILATGTLDREIAIVNQRQATFTRSLENQDSKITSISAGDITLSSSTKGSLAGLSLTSNSMTMSGTNAYFRISTNPSDGYFIYAGTSGTQRNFLLDRQGRINAKEVTLTGKITATSGYIGGFTLTNNSMTLDTTGAYFRISTNASDGYFIYAGTGASGTQRNFLLDRAGRINAKDVTLTGNITATSGKIGGFTIDGNRLTSSNNSRTMRISGLGSEDFLYMYNPSNGALFKVDSNGAVTANLVTITGAVTANSNSTIGGRLNSVTGTLNGVGGSVSGLGGSVSGLGGYVSGLGGYVSYLGGSIGSSSSYMGGYYGGGTYGTVNSASGYLGSVQYYGGASGRLVFEGAITPRGIVTAFAGITCGSAQGSFGNVLYSTLTKKSDERLKQKITRPIQDFAQMIYDLPIKDFEYISAPNKRQLGVIAQEINQTQDRWVSQRLVGHDEDGYLNIDYENLYMAGLIAIQELHKRVKRLEGAI